MTRTAATGPTRRRPRARAGATAGARARASRRSSCRRSRSAASSTSRSTTPPRCSSSSSGASASSRCPACGPTWGTSPTLSRSKNRGQSPISLRGSEDFGNRALTPIFLGELAPRPVENDPQPGGQQLLRLVEADPAPLVVLGAAELGRHRQLDDALISLGEEVARHLAAGVGEGVLVLLTERELEVGEAGLLERLALRGVELGLAGLDYALREIPVLVGAQQEQARAALGAAEHDGAGRSAAGGGPAGVFFRAGPRLGGGGDHRRPGAPPGAAGIGRAAGRGRGEDSGGGGCLKK